MEVLLEIKKAQNGDKQAFCRVIENVERKLYIIARSRLTNTEDIKDAIQDAIMYAYINIKKLKEVEKFNAWIAKILINSCNKIYNQNKTHIFSYSEFDENKFKYESDFIDLENNMNFFNIIDFLDVQEKTLITMYYLDEYTTKEISEILDINESTLRSKLSSIRNKIKVHLGKENK